MNEKESNLTAKDLKMIFESSPDLYLILDCDLTIVEVSEKYLEATMVKRKNILNKNIFEVFPDNPSDPNATGVKNLRASLSRVLILKKPDTMAVQKYDIRKPEEQGAEFEERYWSPINSPVLDENNEVKFIIHRVKDVTQFIKLEEANRINLSMTQGLLKKNEIMGLEIYQRAQELQQINTELRTAKELAEKLAEQSVADNRAKSIFLATMSHELRTSLNGVIGMTELLLDTPLSAQQLEFAETIRLSGEALLSVINNVLDYSKIESGHLQLDNVNFEIQLVIDQAIEIIIGQAYRKRIEIGAYIEPNIPKWVYGDPSRIRQILNNLICNAVKFTKQGEISIWVKLLEKKDKNITLLFEVTDTGIGIEQHAIGKLFQPFTQENAATAIKYGGTGLGLSISKQLIELMGGNIYVQSQLGVGTQFSFTILLKESDHIDTHHFKVLSEFKKSRVLCVDDSEINRKVISNLVTNWGLQCDLADSAANAITMLLAAAAEKNPYALALIDDCMPHMNGFELIKIIRQLNEISKIPIVMLLSLGFTLDENKLKNLLVSTSLSKPIHPGKLYSALVNILHKKLLFLSYEKKPILDKKPLKLKAHILLAEDNFINQQICLRILHKFNLTADIVTTGLEAVQAFKTNLYDLILMDCRMPEMDGYTATEEIRKLEGNIKEHTPIIAMTAHALKGDREKCIKSGMDDYIPKPINVKLLSDLIQKWLCEKDKN